MYQNITYDAVGNIVTDSRDGQTYSYTYNNANRRQSVSDGEQNPTTLATYVYNAFGERVVKSTGSTTQHAHYMDGLRLSETDQNGNAITEYIYLAGTPIAVIKNANQAIPADQKLYYIVPDHLATPRVVLDQDQQIVWRQNATPFGIADIDEDPDGDSNAFQLDARFPGQYWDQETQSSYNYFRDYDQGIGWYLQSDPIGLDGGLNTYMYVGANPLMYYDPYGLFSMDPAWGLIYNATNGWTPSQTTTNIVAGFGNGVTFGLLNNLLNTSRHADPCSAAYRYSSYAGNVVGVGTMWAGGLNGGANSVFWAGRGASTAAARYGTTIGKTPIGALLNGLGVKNRLVWSAASATFALNARGAATAVIRHVAPNSIWRLESALLRLRKVPVVYK